MTKMSMISSTIFMIVLALAPLSDATSFQEVLCSMSYPELNQCNLYCPEGRAWKNGCPTCMCRNTLCQQKICHLGQVCAIRKQVGQYADQFTHVAVCEMMAFTTYPVKATQAPTAATTGFLGSCDYQGRCDANGHCATLNAVCRKDGLCCKVKGQDYSLGGVSIDMAKCMETPEVGQCRALGVQYVYNNDTGRCESMNFGGCVTSGNSFSTMEKCQQTCEYPCERPITVGRCRASIPRYYFNEETEACEAFDLGGCAGTSNYFMTPWDCETHCKGRRKKSVGPTDVTDIERAVTSAPTFIPSTVPGLQGYRDDLRKKIINNFGRREPDVQIRGGLDEIGDGKIWYKQRPGSEVFRVDENGNLIYVTVDNRARTTPTPTTSREDAYVHLGDRIRSAQQMFNNYENGQANYGRLRFPGRSLPAYNARYRTYTTGYQRSADALRRYFN